MLVELGLRHFATVEQLLLSPTQGLTVITGETGAGKSILIDALALSTGARGDSDMVRPGHDRAEFSAHFSLDDAPTARQWLIDNAYDEDDLCQLRRTISTDGRSRAWINGRSCTLQEVRDLSNHLLSIHSQHEHQLLLQKDHQQQLLDEFAGAQTLASDVSQAWQTWQHTSRVLKQALDNANASSEREALLRFQLQELDELDLQQGELESLEAEHKRLANADELLQLCQNTLTLLYEGEEGTVDQLVSQASQMMLNASRQDDGLASIADGIESARLQLEASVGDLRHYLDRLEQDPERLALVEARLDSIFSLARKHRVRPDELVTHHQTIAQEAADFGNVDARLEQLEADEQHAKAHYQQQAETLSALRRDHAGQLTQSIQAHLRQLGMQGARLEISLETTAPSSRGLEQVSFLFTANPGQPPKPLAKVASGGELSRVSLAIQVVCAERLTLPCLVFDEVDVGVGGGIADVVGQLLKKLGNKAQVLCITHQPQVASQGNQHWQVHKTQTENSTLTSISTLNQAERIDELSRMLGGIEITPATRLHAKDMLMQGQKPD